MELYDGELQEALRHLAAIGREPGEFSFERTYLPPDPDGGGMFTVRYEVAVRQQKTGKSSTFVGGIGLDWVAAFQQALAKGRFD
jgi:hypothetical protein